VTFQPSGRSVFVLPGTTMLEAAGRAGLTIVTPCGGAGTCGKCRVQVIQGAGSPTPAERQRFSAEELQAGWRLACQSRITAPAVVATPDESLFASGQQIVTHSHDGGDAEVLPGVRKLYVTLDEPTLSDAAGDLPRLAAAVGPVKVHLEMLRRLGPKLRACGFAGTAVLADHTLIDFEAGDTTGRCYGVAFDIGTTTVAASVLDLCTGKELAVTSRMNPQVSFGDDVLSRIKYASASAEKLAELRDAIIKVIAEMIDALATAAGISRENIYEVSLAGNTTMEHLLCGLPVGQLGSLPFVPVHQRGLVIPAEQVAPAIHRRAVAYVLPVIAGFVGGDAVAGMLATRLAEADGPTLMIDIGTNGEIILACDGKLLAASTAAGPAFEGARISCGMRAARGAIEKIVFNDDIALSVIGNVEPVGICGSALVDLAAGLLDAGVITPSGRMLTGDELPAGLAEAIRRRVRTGDDGQGRFVLGELRQTTLAITQRDVRELQLATGAIRAGVNILLRIAGLEASQLRGVLIAGGFGSFIRRSRAQRIGLLPGGVDHKLIRHVGNTSLSGAKWALLSTAARKKAEKLAAETRHVQLSQDPDFQNEFAEAMIFPAG